MNFLNQAKQYGEKLYNKAGEAVKGSGTYFDYLKPWKTIPALGEAYKKAKEHKDIGFFQKLDIFWQSFKEAVTGVRKEKEGVTHETEELVDQGVEETLKPALAGAGLDESVQDEDREFYEETMATAVRAFEKIDKQTQGYALSGLGKVQKAEKGEKEEKLTYEEASSLASVSALTLREFKKQHPQKADFKNAFERFVRISEKSKFPLKRVLSSSVLGIFKITDRNEGLKFLKAMGITPSLGDFAGRGDSSDAAELLAGIAKQPIENKDGIVAFLKKRLFPKTTKTNLAKAVTLINKMIVGKAATISPDRLADLVFYIDDADFPHLSAVLIGKKGITT